jgi:hypothetical protein
MNGTSDTLNSALRCHPRRESAPPDKSARWNLYLMRFTALPLFNMRRIDS